MRLGLALGSGGARGWCHIGVLQRLREIGVEPDVVAGCSMGALVGAAWAAGRLDALETWVRSLTMQKIAGYIDLRLAGGGLVRGMGIVDVLAELGVPDEFSELDRSFLAVATDMSTGREIWLQRGDVRKAVRGSVGIPGLFTPYKLDGKWLLDGGLTNPVPVSACRALGADVTISVNPNGKPGHRYWEPQVKQSSFAELLENPAVADHLPVNLREALEANAEHEVPPQYLDVVSTSIDILTDFLRQTRAAIDPADVALEVELPQMTVLELYRGQEAMAEGRRLVDENREKIERIAGQGG